MTYVVVEACIKCKYMDCIEVCPVDCFYEGENMLAIHPDECIDCGVCEPECPVDAIVDEDEASPEVIALNAIAETRSEEFQLPDVRLLGRLREASPSPG